MQLGLEVMPVRLVRPHDQLFKGSPLVHFFEPRGNGLEMMQDFIMDTALGVPALITTKAVTPPPSGQSVKHTFPFSQLVQIEIKKASLLAINHDYRQARLRAQHTGKRFQVKAPIDEQPGCRKLRRHVKFAPQLAAGTGKD